MKVLHLISSSGMYGAEAVILALSKGLNNLPEHSSLIAVFSNSDGSDTQLQEAAARCGIASVALPCRGQIDTSFSKKLRELVQSSDVDLVHAHGYKADVYAYLALHGSLPLVSTCHTWYDNDLAVRLYGALDRWLLRRFDAVVAVTEQVQTRLLDAGVAPERVRIINNGIVLHLSQAAEEARAIRLERGLPRRVGLVGRLAPEKGVDLFLSAAAEVLKQQPGIEFVVAGDGPDRQALENQIGATGLGKSFTLLGRVEDMPAFYASIDLLVSASRQEGLPIALLEGMSFALPVVGTSVGSTPLIVRNGATGFLVEPGDTKALAESITHVLSDRSLRQQLGKGARQLIESEFSVDRMTADYLALYEQACTQRTQGTA